MAGLYSLWPSVSCPSEPISFLQFSLPVLGAFNTLFSNPLIIISVFPGVFYVYWSIDSVSLFSSPPSWKESDLLDFLKDKVYEPPLPLYGSTPPHILSPMLMDDNLRFDMIDRSAGVSKNWLWMRENQKVILLLIASPPSRELGVTCNKNQF